MMKLKPLLIIVGFSLLWVAAATITIWYDAGQYINAHVEFSDYD